MVIFDQKSTKNTVFSDNFWSKMTIASNLKLIKFNRTPAFYLRGYGISNEVLNVFMSRLCNIPTHLRFLYFLFLSTAFERGDKDPHLILYWHFTRTHRQNFKSQTVESFSSKKLNSIWHSLSIENRKLLQKKKKEK